MLNSQYTDNNILEDETVQDEEKNSKYKSWNIPPEGPNINLKCFKKKYSTEEEKNFILEKVKIKKKTKLGLNHNELKL